jgi:hypothetical protein
MNVSVFLYAFCTVLELSHNDVGRKKMWLGSFVISCALGPPLNLAVDENTNLMLCCPVLSLPWHISIIPYSS